MDIRHQNRESSPVRLWMTRSNYHDDESALGALGSTSSTQLMNRGNTEAPSYIVLEVKGNHGIMGGRVRSLQRSAT